MKATGILINATDKTIKTVQVDGLEEMCKALGCERVDRAAIGEKDDTDLWVDDEGLYNSKDFFYYEGLHQPFAGNGLILGANEEGDTVSTKLTLEEVKKYVRFLDAKEAVILSDSLSG